ncbi:unnamed protein product [Owenia fusiformis]|uniref:Uncharacterized protein n=1 Tax=Owenia fusiformis TaxID=6347 RepID=A0A8J1XTA1_OWEFU|nr:unnamed protein product [Owenia fusiformis]
MFHETKRTIYIPLKGLVLRTNKILTIISKQNLQMMTHSVLVFIMLSGLLTPADCFKLYPLPDTQLTDAGYEEVAGTQGLTHQSLLRYLINKKEDEVSIRRKKKDKNCCVQNLASCTIEELQMCRALKTIQDCGFVSWGRPCRSVGFPMKKRGGDFNDGDFSDLYRFINARNEFEQRYSEARRANAML